MSIREEIEELEAKTLCKDAALSKNTLGRKVSERPCEIRTEFQRDRDRIIHSKSFRRLKHKTQVFISPKGDHYRTRLTHTLEVSQIARTVARALKYNEDLTEAIALGHDVGHTPFGHAGESALNDLCPYGFKHYEQGIRVFSVLEKEGKGLNLTEEVLNGIVCHTKGEEAFTAEGRIVRLCDRVAYVNHDIEDAIRAGVLDPKNIPQKFIEIFGNRFSERIDTMVKSIIENSTGKTIKMSDELTSVFSGIHDFMYSEVYLSKDSFSQEQKVPFIIGLLYKHYKTYPNKMPDYIQKIAREDSLERAVCDYIAGMTDDYAVNVFKEIFIPKSIISF
ncbi:MAG: deoxyguanosinetriphosphate triphosphohydrolase [Clostridia bacterium]|nr:deoxyguanosinetriphosphate triphosphohydrolase [Clostridia bacterium]